MNALAPKHDEPIQGSILRKSQYYDDDLISLPVAIAVFWPNGPLTVASLRTEIRNNRLTCHRIAGKILVTPTDLAEMIVKCREKPKARASISAGARDENPSTSSSIKEASNKAQAAALTRLQELRKRSRNTSAPSTRPPSEPTILLSFPSRTS